MEYKSEEEFLKAYNPDEYKRLSMTTDILLFSVSDVSQVNYRKTNEKVMSILLVKRENYPFKDKWCVPGGFLKLDEELEDCPKRILEEETNLKDIYMEQLYTFGGVHRDPRMRIVSTAYMALIDKNNLKDTLSPNACWFNIEYKEKNNEVTLILSSIDEELIIKAKKVLIDSTSGRHRYEIIENKSIAFDHAEVILTGLERLKNKVEYTDIVFNMMPDLFTLGELQKVYEIILGKSLLMPAFRRIIANKVQKTEEIQGGGGHRPSYLFKYKKR
ncbi:MAG: NUDIX domain-containing protein [Clostridia bacterium]|nr:NUDIX domain-containing protein [Clostridia bacterium]